MILLLHQFTHNWTKRTTELVKRRVVLNSAKFKVSYSPSAGLSESFMWAALDLIVSNKNIWDWNWWIVNVSRNIHPPSSFFQTDLPFTSSPVPSWLTSALFSLLLTSNLSHCRGCSSSILQLQHQQGLGVLGFFFRVTCLVSPEKDFCVSISRYTCQK